MNPHPARALPDLYYGFLLRFSTCCLQVCGAWSALISHEAFWAHRLSQLESHFPSIAACLCQENSAKRRYLVMKQGIVPWCSDGLVTNPAFDISGKVSSFAPAAQSGLCLGHPVWLSPDKSRVSTAGSPPGLCVNHGAHAVLERYAMQPSLHRISAPEEQGPVQATVLPPPVPPSGPQAVTKVKNTQVICSDASDEFHLQGISRVTLSSIALEQEQQGGGGGGGLSTLAGSTAVSRPGKTTGHFVRIFKLQDGHVDEQCAPILMPAAARVMCVRVLARSATSLGQGATSHAFRTSATSYDHLLGVRVGDVSGAMRHRPLQPRVPPPLAVGLAGLAGGLTMLFDCHTGAVLRYIAPPRTWVSTQGPEGISPHVAMEQCVLRWELEHNAGPSRPVDVCSIALEWGGIAVF